MHLLLSLFFLVFNSTEPKSDFHIMHKNNVDYKAVKVSDEMDIYMVSECYVIVSSYMLKVKCPVLR